MSPASWNRSPSLTGIALMAAASFFFACLDSCAKWLGHSGLPTGEVVWARYAANFIVALPLINPWTVRGLLTPKRPVLQVARGFLILVSTVLNFIALQYLQLAQTVSIMFSTPLLVAVFARPILGEKVSLPRAAAIGLGFLGVLVVTQPGTSGFHWAMTLSIAGAFVYAAANIMARILVRDDDPNIAFFYVGAVGTVLLAPLMPVEWVWPSSGAIWLAMAGMGVFGAIGHWCLILAHKYAPASVLAPFIYTQMIWMVLSGWTFFGDVPDGATFIGAAVVVVSGLILLWRERAERKTRT